jgi:FkbM family methyltransferase
MSNRATDIINDPNLKGREVLAFRRITESDHKAFSDFFIRTMRELSDRRDNLQVFPKITDKDWSELEAHITKYASALPKNRSEAIEISVPKRRHSLDSTRLWQILKSVPGMRNVALALKLTRGARRPKICRLAERAAYFLPEAVLPWRKRETFVDVGCYDAMTSLEFVGICPDGKIIAFEPEPMQARTCRKFLKKIPNAIIIEAATSDTPGTTTFMRSGTNSKFSETGDIIVRVTTLDEELKNDEVTFIKMDIEGAELPTLRGAEKIIREQKPRLAICIYHLLDDIRTIPEYILSLNPNYKLYIRQYSPGKAETVLYAV